MATSDAPSIGLSRGVKWVFPTGVILSVAGVVLCGLLDHMEDTQNWEFTAAETAFLPSLFVGTAFVIIGSFLDRRRLPVPQTRNRGKLCLAVSAVSFTLLSFFGNVHTFTFTLIFPALAGLIAGIIFIG